ncbi:MAG: hypothetical protein ACREF0_20750, partial [Acetobacteraceae bacterium]
MQSLPSCAKRSAVRKILTAGVAAAGLGGFLAASGCLPFAAAKAAAPNGKKVHVALILSTYINPYWIYMHKATAAEAKKLGVDLTFQAGQTEGDTSSQITAIDNAIAAG